MLTLDNLWKIIQKAFYMPLLLFVCIVLSIVVQLLNRKTSLFLPILAYSSFALLLFSVGTFISLFESNLNIKHRVQEFVNILFASVELIVFGFYFHKILKQKLGSIIIALSILSFLLLSFKFYYLVLDEQTDIDQVITFADQIIAVELTLLIVFCLSYYFALLKDTSNKSLLNSPSFWITTGLLFYSLVSAPFFTIGIQILKGNPKLYDSLFGIHYLFASILFLGICKASLCHQRLTN